jgi:hypothetical protein
MDTELRLLKLEPEFPMQKRKFSRELKLRA